jgi:hypothetical protein
MTEPNPNSNEPKKSILSSFSSLKESTKQRTKALVQLKDQTADQLKQKLDTTKELLSEKTESIKESVKHNKDDAVAITKHLTGDTLNNTRLGIWGFLDNFLKNPEELKEDLLKGRPFSERTAEFLAAGRYWTDSFQYTKAIAGTGAAGGLMYGMYRFHFKQQRAIGIVLYGLAGAIFPAGCFWEWRIQHAEENIDVLKQTVQGRFEEAKESVSSVKVKVEKMVKQRKNE